MPQTSEEKKIIETRALIAARKAGVPIPLGETPSEEPDFLFDEGKLGIEVSELMLAASSNFGIAPVAEAAFNLQVAQMAQELYYRSPDATPVKVSLYFPGSRGEKRDKFAMAKTLAEFVRRNVPTDKRFVTFSPRRSPEQFGSIVISLEPEEWWCAEGATVTLSDIPTALSSRIESKNRNVTKYRGNLAPKAGLWLLLYTVTSVSRSMPIPHGIEDRIFKSEFDRIFWYVCLEDQFIEIRKSEIAEAASPCR
jgi:hypothetical protein